MNSRFSLVNMVTHSVISHSLVHIDEESPVVFRRAVPAGPSVVLVAQVGHTSLEFLADHYTAGGVRHHFKIWKTLHLILLF